MELDRLLRRALAEGASDLHLKAGRRPVCRIDGRLRPLDDEPVIEAATLDAMADTLFSPAQREAFERRQHVDLAYGLGGEGRFRFNVFRQQGTTAAAIRLVTPAIRSIDQLCLPPVLDTLAAEERGLILVTGAAGSGKSTTLAAIVNRINSTRAAHVITIEDPVEYVHADARSIVNQREVGTDAPSFADALHAALRQDPDVILVGEMRDAETIATALHAADTGHLVLSTLHTLDAVETITRIVSVFPAAQQAEVRLQVAALLRAAVAQRLVPRADGIGRVPAAEVLVSTPSVRDVIADPARTPHLRELISQGGSQYGMQSFDGSLFDMYSRGLITYEAALGYASSRDDLARRVHGVSGASEFGHGLPARPGTGGIVDGHAVTRFGR